MIEAAPLNIQNVRFRLSQLLTDGNMSSEVIECLYDGQGFVPAEGYLFDYKRKWPDSKNELVKYIRHVAAFHNTFGGYILFGVDETEADSIFTPCVTVEPTVDIKQFKDLLREYLTSAIEVSIRAHKIKAPDGFEYSITLLHIPKRLLSIEPVAIKKATNDAKGRPLYEIGALYLRDGDNSIPAQQQVHWRAIYGQRQNPYVSESTENVTPTLLQNNLPDRSLIYKEFFGRSDELEQLWRWFGDDFSRVRVLAGEGGLGKTSIAYEFASDVCRNSPLNFEQVVWLTAKKRQFRALQDSFEELGLEVFETTSEMLRQLGACLGLLETELNECADPLLPRLVKQAVTLSSALVVIDDLDSLELDEQKRAIEVCQQFSGTSSRFLFTTRKNITASSASSIDINGFDRKEFNEFVEAWIDRLKLACLTSSDMKRLHETTRGSPLFTESILRLLKSGIRFDEAIRSWEGHLGIEVRNAALKREVMQIQMVARKVLVIIATMGSCSFSEIKTHSGFSEQTVLDAADELQSLFLVSTPALANEKRFAISSTTRQVVHSLGADLVPGYNELVKEIRIKKYRPVGHGHLNASSSVAAAINQAMAQISEGHPENAVRTADEVNQKFEGKNCDLLSVKARALAIVPGTSPMVIRKAFQAAYDEGQRKDVFFDCWFSAEMAAPNPDGATQVADFAIESEPKNTSFWFFKRIESRIAAARQHLAADTIYTANQIKNAMKDIRVLSKGAREHGAEMQLNLRFYLETCSDIHWSISRSSSNVGAWSEAIDQQLESISIGDKRHTSYIRAAVAIVGLKASAPLEKERLRNLFEQKLRLVIACFKGAPKAVARSQEFQIVFHELSEMELNS